MCASAVRVVVDQVSAATFAWQSAAKSRKSVLWSDPPFSSSAQSERVAPRMDHEIGAVEPDRGAGGPHQDRPRSTRVNSPYATATDEPECPAEPQASAVFTG